MPSPKQWWRRAAAAAKDKRSLYLTRMAGGLRNSDMEAAVIRATSHDERSMDYKNAGHVFAWARTSPSFLQPLMWALSRRASRTRSWAVALKSLLLAHGLLLCSDGAAALGGRLPFDLSDFRCRSARNWGFSAFVRAYFNFLDHRSLFLNHHRRDDDEDREQEEEEGDRGGLERVEGLQALLGLLMQIRPYADGMEVGLILEAMDCAMIEIFEVYSGICNGIACFLVGYMGADPAASSLKGGEEERRRRGLLGIRVLVRAAEQSSQLSSYFDLCRGMGVLNAAELPPVERIPEEDIMDLEMLVMGGVPTGEEEKEEVEDRETRRGGIIEGGKEEEVSFGGRPGTVMTKEWVVFDDDLGEGKGYSGNPFGCPGDSSRQPSALTVNRCHHSGVAPLDNGNLIELT